jgi:hypothetical protein
MFHWRKLLLGFLVILLDLFVGLVLGTLLMDYDDSYNPSKGEYWSWDSMNTFQKGVSLSIQLWWLVNVVAVLYWLYRIFYRKQRNGPASTTP